MGAVWSSEPFESQCVVMCDSNDTKGKLQTALAQLPEYSGFSIGLQSTLKPTDLSGTCDVDYTYTNVRTGYAQRDQRRITFSGTKCEPVVGTSRSGLMYARQRATKEGVYAYYRELANYNQRWNAGGWQADGATYDPPLPSWTDPVFARNVGLYNDNLKRVIGTGGVFDKALSGSLSDAMFQTNFQKYIAPTPGAPTPPEMSDVLLDEPDQIVGQTAPPTFQDIIGGADENTGSANGLANTAASTKNLNTYETLIAGYIDRAGPDYDPPKEGDNYETLLIKFNKAYDIVAGKRTGSMDMNSAGENRSAFYKRFIGRGFAFPIPEAQVPLTRPVEGVMEYNYRPYNFNDRQRELIEYCPVEAGMADMTRLKVNFCAALGFHENITKDGGKKRCDTGDCCIPLAPLPAYEEPTPGPPRPKKPSVVLPPGYERLDPYSPESIVNDTESGGTYFGDSVLPASSMRRRPPPSKKAASACPGPKEYVIPGKRFYVESAPTRAQNAKKRLEYVMSKPVDSCSKNPAGMAEGFVAIQHAAHMKGSQQEENSKKMAALRGMNF